MKKQLIGLGVVTLMFGGGVSNALVLDFAGGTAYLSDGTSVATTNNSSYGGVDYYIEDGFKVDFIGGTGNIGNYYAISLGNPGNIEEAVLHAHWSSLTEIHFSYVSGQVFDLNYMDLTSNTTVGGGLASGDELSYVTSSTGSSMLLPSSDWGMGYLFTGVADNDATPIERLWLDSNYDGITSFSVTSQNASCFGLDNFYLDQEAPPVDPVPEPATMFLFGIGLVGLVGSRIKKKKK
jgi:PEP-CTERM motif